MPYRPIRGERAEERRRQIQQVQMEPVPLSGGFRGDDSPIVLPLNTAARADNVRHDKQGLRKARAFSLLGNAADARILALGEYKYADGKKTIQRTIRIFRDPVSLLGVIERWNGTNWERIADSDVEMMETYLSTESLQNAYTMADGNNIFIFIEEREVFRREFFFDGDVLRDVGESEALIISGMTGDVISPVIVRYRVTFSGDQPASVRVAVKLNGIIVDQHTTEFDGENDPTRIVERVFHQDVSNGDEIKIEIVEVERGTLTHRNFLSDHVGGDPDIRRGVRSPLSVTPAGGRYIFFAHVSSSIPGDMDLELRLRFEGSTVETFPHTVPDGVSNFTREVVYDGEVDGFELVRVGGASRLLTASPIVDWFEETEVHVQGLDEYEDQAGVEFDDTGDLVLIFEVISPDAPGAKYIFSFADRLVALQDRGDPQSLAWSASGQIRNWIGEGSGQIFLIDARADSVDDLMCGAPLGSNMAVIIRKRSIMRLFPTGAVQQALGVTYWVEDIGTESPHSLQVVAGGVMFLAHNLMVYHLSEGGGLVPVGVAIHEELKRRVARSGLRLVDSVITAEGEYIIGVPEDGVDHITALWSFNFQRFRDREEPDWVRREVGVQRLGVTSQV